MNWSGGVGSGSTQVVLYITLSRCMDFQEARSRSLGAFLTLEGAWLRQCMVNQTRTTGRRLPEGVLLGWTLDGVGRRRRCIG
jgi:hypothetical protein